MEITILSPEEVEFKEKDVQNAFEKDLSKLEDGLEYVRSELMIGTGRIDTLAFDANSQPVFIEFKRKGQFGKDALIQLMEYLSWFLKDENHMEILSRIIRQHLPDAKEFEPYIRLICVVTDIDDQVQNAIYAMSNHVKVYSYLVARDTAQKVVLVPKLEIDNMEVESHIPIIESEADILSKHQNLEELFKNLKVHLEKDGATSYSGKNCFRFKKERVFAEVHFRKKYINLELRVGIGVIKDPNFKYWRQGESDWGYTYIYPANGITGKVITWIENAKEFSRGFETDENES